LRMAGAFVLRWHADRFGVSSWGCCKRTRPPLIYRAARPSGRHSLGQCRDDTRVQRAMARIGNHETPRCVGRRAAWYRCALRSPQNAETNRQHTVEALARRTTSKALSRSRWKCCRKQTHIAYLRGIERLAGAAFVATSEPLSRDIDAQAVASLGDCLDQAAHATAEDSALPSVAKLRRPLNPGRLHKLRFQD